MYSRPQALKTFLLLSLHSTIIIVLSPDVFSETDLFLSQIAQIFSVIIAKLYSVLAMIIHLHLLVKEIMFGDLQKNHILAADVG